MSEWRDPTEAEVEDAAKRYPKLSRERATRLARAEAWQRDRGLMPPLGEKSRGDGRRWNAGGVTREPGERTSSFEATTAKRGESFARSSGKPPDGLTYGAGKKREEKS